MRRLQEGPRMEASLPFVAPATRSILRRPRDGGGSSSGSREVEIQKFRECQAELAIEPAARAWFSTGLGGETRGSHENRSYFRRPLDIDRFFWPDFCPTAVAKHPSPHRRRSSRQAQLTSRTADAPSGLAELATSTADGPPETTPLHFPHPIVPLRDKSPRPSLRRSTPPHRPRQHAPGAPRHSCPHHHGAPPASSVAPRILPASPPPPPLALARDRHRQPASDPSAISAAHRSAPSVAARRAIHP
ncbi:uncharacterized protein SOCE836_054490 [Sorangium cellulosum]|uniref:Uncharacterized protein n=1 Tax=Sorangium cellulosum TaxID=56 RepID=A0A4P2QSM1_SORCE|nr:uncharacterized protein SOCE836_054490 [Sorangium cellulosum]WCQ92609.1 hypothetical protein NQZ70_05352 [Sorangium sp. Soce836]